MASAAFRAYFGTRPATAEELARIEEIVVEQEIDMVWQARVRMTMLLDDQGRWRVQPSTLAPPFSRFRVELQLDAGEWVPLIDGTVAGWETGLGRPGNSHARMIVRDDMVLMNREEATEVFRDQTDSELAAQIFTRFSTLVPGTITPTTERPPSTVRRGTSIRFLRDLAKANGFHAYVEPGALLGTSLGHFRAPDPAPPTLPPMILFGNGRNLSEANFTEEHEGPERTRASAIRISDQQVVSSQASFEDEALMGALPAISNNTGALREPPPDEIRRENPDAVAQAQTRASAYAHRVTGQVKSGCYPAVLAPYRKVTIRAGDLPQSGDWLLWSVRHRITPMTYTQHFSARRNALSEASSGATSALAGVF
jgi:hypothetical protein